MKWLVTGAGGFIGRNLVATLSRLDSGPQVVAVARTQPADAPAGTTWIQADLARSGWTSALPEDDFDFVVHLAQSRHFRDFPARARDIFDVNVGSTFELAEWSLRHRVRRFLFASTGNVYGSTDRVNREDGPCDPESMYGASKLSAEILLKPFAPFMDVLAMRLFGVYGPGQANAMLPGIIQRFRAGEEIVLAANVGVRFNPIYVEDCTALIARLASESALGGAHTLNVCGPEVVDLRRAVDILEQASGKQARVRITDEQPKQLVGSTEKLAALCGNRASVSFHEGLTRTLAAGAPRTGT